MDSQEETPLRRPRNRAKPRRRLASGFATIRDLISFVLGIVIIGHEVFYSPTIEAAAVGVGIVLAGLPLAFGADERRK